MKKARLLLGLGVWVAILPHLGFPYFIKNLLFLLTGLLLVYMAYLIRKQARANRIKENTYENFSENTVD